MEEEEKVVGRTKNVGFQFSITRTIALSPDAAWDFLLSEAGVTVWLGNLNFDNFEVGNALTTAEGIDTKITIFKPESHLRLAWKFAHWMNNSFIEIRVFDIKGRAKIGLLHTHMLNVQQREEVKTHWGKIFDEITAKY